LELATQWVAKDGLLLIEMPSWCDSMEDWKGWRLVRRIGQRVHQKPSVAVYELSV